MDTETNTEYRLNQACFSKVKKWLIILENGLKKGYFATNLRPFSHFVKSGRKIRFIYLIHRKIYHI